MENMKSIFFFVTCLLTCTFAAYELDTKITEIKSQIELEMQASLFYQTYAHYFESSDVALHGFAKYFYDQSIEEKKHADKLMTYLNQRNVQVGTLASVTNFCEKLRNSTYCDIITGKTPKKLFDYPAFNGIMNAIELEKKVFDSLENIIKDSKDPQLNHFIEHEYLDEQIQSIKELRDLKTQLRKVKDNSVGVLLIDRWLLEDKRKTEL